MKKCIAKRKLKQRITTLISKVQELQDLENETGMTVSCGLEGMKQNLMNAYFEL